jgi:predicted GIY-YIG superfamily endonuclease
MSTKIYLIQAENTNKYKIGYSRNPHQRLKQLQTANGEGLLLLKEFKTEFATKLEKQLHRYYLNKQTLGEWFQLDEEDVQKFISLCETKENTLRMLRETNTYIQDREKW